MENTIKKKGDYVILFENSSVKPEVYQIKNLPEIFQSNRLATKEEIEEAKQLNYLI